MSKPVPTRYRTLNWSSYNAPLRERGSLTVWLDPVTPWHAAASGKRGAQPVYSDAAIQACLTMKGEGRPGNRPVACFSPERAEPRACSACRCARRPASWR
ncbi:DDE family transposase, partial [Palleronia aestuarii]